MNGRGWGAPPMTYLIMPEGLVGKKKRNSDDLVPLQNEKTGKLTASVGFTTQNSRCVKKQQDRKATLE